jgi:hypothetical protein
MWVLTVASLMNRRRAMSALDWIVGLFVAPPAPPATADAATLHGYFVGHGPVILLQSLLVHALPGIALAAIFVVVLVGTLALAPVRPSPAIP